MYENVCEKTVDVVKMPPPPPTRAEVKFSGGLL